MALEAYLVGRQNEYTQEVSMKRPAWHLLILFIVVGCLTKVSSAQQGLTWREVREKFEANNQQKAVLDLAKANLF